MVKCSLECDIIDSLQALPPKEGLPCCVIHKNKPVDGAVVGAIQIVMTHTSQHSINSSSGKINKYASKKVNPEGEIYQHLASDKHGINWRAYGIKKNSIRDLSSHRPRNRVRAVPLAESVPELSKVLQDYHKEAGGTSTENGVSRRSISVVRGDSSMSTLTYDDLQLLFKRFQGSTKGTVKYRGSFMQLLDIPSPDVALQKLVNLVYKIGVTKTGSFEKVHHFLLLLQNLILLGNFNL
jgi:hypothetical protein